MFRRGRRLSNTNSVKRDLGQERVILTGATGLLGTAMRKVLADQEVNSVLALSRSDCDLLDETAVLKAWKAFSPTIVIHLAAWVAGIQGNLRFSGEAFYVNTKINLNVIEASRLTGVQKIIAAGTTAIYSDDVAIPIREEALWHGPPHISEAAYGNAKRAMLAQLEAYKTQYGIDYCYMICTNLYGINDRFDEKFGHVVPSLIVRFHRAAKQSEEQLVLWGDGSAIRDFLFADDAAEAFVLAAKRGSGIFNVASGQAVTIAQLSKILQKLTNYDGEIVWDTSKPSGQQRRGYDISRLRALGWEPTVNLEKGLQRTIDWYTEHFADVRRQ